jgi:hypothetical protein
MVWWEALRGSNPIASEAILFVWIFSDLHKKEAIEINEFKKIPHILWL